MKIIGIVGTGAMGSGIAQVAAMAGCEIRLFDQRSESISGALININQSLQKFVEKGKLTPEQAVGIHGAIYPCEKLTSFSDCDLVIEAIFEDLEVKKKLFLDLESIVSPSCILATNTSSLSITSIAATLSKPERCIGIHFFNPPVLMKLVEVIPAIQTSNDITLQTIKRIESWGKIVALAKDTPGFIVNKVARPYYSEALRLYDEGIATMEEIDQSMVDIGFKMGPFMLMDFIGHDVNYKVTESVWRAFYFDPRYKPSISQCRLVEAGYLGRKSGQGYYKYVDKKPDSSFVKGKKSISDRILTMLINEAADTVQLGIASMEDIDGAVVNGLNYPRGLFDWLQDIGPKRIIQNLEKLYHYYQEDRYRTSPFLHTLSKKSKT